MKQAKTGKENKYDIRTPRSGSEQEERDPASGNKG